MLAVCQADRVRTLKEGVTDENRATMKPTIDEEVKRLLALKRELALAEGKNPDENTKKGKK